MLRLNLFTSLEKLVKITKETIENMVKKLAANLPATVENYIKLRTVADIMNQVAEQIKVQLLESGIESENWKSVTVSSKSGASTKIFDDPELTELEKVAKEATAKVKARKTFLIETENYTVKKGKPTIQMTIPK